MAFKISSAVAIARAILNDTTEEYRYTDPDLIEYGNGALRALPQVRPEWLESSVEYTCVDGARQELPAGTSHAVVRVERIKNGGVVTAADHASLDAFSPDWMSGTPDAAKHWFPDPSGNLRTFLLYPPATAGQILIVRHVRIPGPYAAEDDTGLPETITEAVADYIVGVAEGRNDESVLSARSTQFINQFAARLGAAGQKGPQ